MRLRLSYTQNDAEVAKELDQVLVPTLLRLGRRIVANAKQRAPVKTGLLRNSINSRVVSPRRLEVSANTRYAAFVHEGTGLYGPSKARIYPKKAPRLVFEVGGRLVFAKSVSGMKGRPFLRAAVDEEIGRLRATGKSL